MIEKVNPDHPDKVADRIAGAIVDLGYKMQENPKIAVEVLIGHGNCKIIIERYRIAETKDIKVEIILAKQDEHLAKNQEKEIRCGDNGIFKGMPVTKEQIKLSNIARTLYSDYLSDGKYILDGEKLIICQSNAKTEELKRKYPTAIINPLGEWTGGINVDTGATNRKLGSDMADSITGGRTTWKRFE